MEKGETGDATETADEWTAKREGVGFSSTELNGIATRAKEEAGLSEEGRIDNPLWKAAYMELALAADHLALMFERTSGEAEA